MFDPLSNFDWATLYERYDELCPRFEPRALFLSSIPSRPQSDRALYRALTERFQTEFYSPTGVSLETYEAMLYWKLYSQPAAVKRTCSRLHEDAILRRATSALLRAVCPQEISGASRSIVEQIQLLGRYGIWGMKSSAALAVKTTFLHFVAPTINPIFDKQVLLAVGVKERNANQKIELLQPYASQAKMLAEKYSQDLKLFSCESPIRLIDMALWVIRGTRISTPAESTDRRSSRRAIT